MRRRLLNLLTALSLLLFVAFAALWVRSMWAADVVTLQVDRSADSCLWVYAEIHRNGMGVGTHRRPLREDSGRWEWQHGAARSYAGAGWAVGSAFNRVGFSCGTYDHRDHHIVAACAPFGFLLPAAAVLPAARFYAARRARRCKQTQGRCVQCGYDLRATPTRCPECGTVACVTTV